MNSSNTANGAAVGDQFALLIQELYTTQRIGDQPLLKIDNREEARSAPYQLDTAKGRLHKTGCRSIPESSLSSLYGVWHFGAGDREFACKRCKPVPNEDERVDPRVTIDLFYGVLSILGQFGDVLRERGKEFRKSNAGERLNLDLDGVYRGLGKREKEMLGTMLSSLDGVIKMVKEFDEDLQEKSPHNGRPPED